MKEPQEVMVDERTLSPAWYENISLEDAKVFIRQNIATAARSFLAVGYYLKQVRDRELFREDGHETIWAFALEEYGISKSTASRYMAMNDRFSLDGNSPIVKEDYREFSRSQLQEMLYLTEEQMVRVAPESPVMEIRRMREEKTEAKGVPGQMDITDFPDYLPNSFFPVAGQVRAAAIEPGSFQISAHDMIEESVAISQQTEAAATCRALDSDTRVQPLQEQNVIYDMDGNPDPAEKRPFCLEERKEIHKKIFPEFYQAVCKDRKRFELRKDEDEARPGDLLFLHEWSGEAFTGNTSRHTVRYVLRGVPEYGLMDGYCIIGW